MESSAPIPVVIIGGYLGAGKTTLINQCLQDGLRNAAIIVNDFGSINIDASLISEFSSDTIELTNGCICCSVGESLADTFFSILDRPQRPELIVVETSGVADPQSIAAYTHMKGLTNAGVFVLVDAEQAVSTFQHPLLKSTVERQIQAAHLLGITKSDVATTDSLVATRELMKFLAPHTAVIEASPTALSRLVNTPTRAVEPEVSTTETHPFTHSLHHFDKPITREELLSFLESLEKNVVRAKGIIELSDSARVLVQKTGEHLSITPTELSESGLVLIQTR